MAFASLGFSSDDPKVGVPVFGVFFIIVFALILLYVKKHHKKDDSSPKNITFIHKILGIVLILIALFSPVIGLRKIDLPFAQNLVIFVITAILIVLGMLAINIINNSKGKNFGLGILGYIMLIIISSIPALGASKFLTEYFPNIYNAIGTTYWASISVAIFSWWGFTLFQKQN